MIESGNGQPVIMHPDSAGGYFGTVPASAEKVDKSPLADDPDAVFPCGRLTGRIYRRIGAPAFWGRCAESRHIIIDRIQVHTDPWVVRSRGSRFLFRPAQKNDHIL